MKLDILAFAAHPDDVELAASGTVIKHIQKGKKVGIVDLTKGELGSRGNAETRSIEAQNSANIMGLSIRENLDMGDGFFEENEGSLLKVISMIRKYQPDVILCNSVTDRHPDHARAGNLVSRACFLSGLLKVETRIDGAHQMPFRPKSIYRYIQDRWIEPDVIVDISEQFELKMKSILAFETQFYNPDKNIDGPETPISSKDFIDFLKGRAIQFGRLINTQYGEGFNVERPIGVDDLTELI
jgi:N-acetylglucosamine malate deacetylase 1